MKIFFRAIILTLATASIISAQSKVGSGLEFLNLTPSVIANGMGTAGAAVTNSYSQLLNPAGVAFLHDDLDGWFTCYPTRLELQPESPSNPRLSFYSLSANLLSRFYPETRFTLGAAYSRVRIETDPVDVTTYQSDSTSVFFSDDKSDILTIGLGYSQYVDVAAGISISWIESKYPEQELDFNTYDYGLYMQVPFHKHLLKPDSNAVWSWRLQPSAGLVWRNHGGDIELQSGKMELPKSRTFGLAVSSGLVNNHVFENWAILEITPTIEFEKALTTSQSITKTGLETGLGSAFYFRLGKIDYEDTEDMTTWGFSINSRGLVRVIGKLTGSTDFKPNSFKDIIFNKFQLTFDFARYGESSSDPLAGTDFYGVSISL